MLPDDLTELLSAYIDGELGARQRKVVTRLLDDSEEARTLLCRLERDAVLLRELPARKVPFDLTSSILGTIAATETRVRFSVPAAHRACAPRGKSLWTRYTAAAAVLVAIGITSWLVLGGAGQGTGELANQEPSAPKTNETTPENNEADPVIGPEVPHRPGSHSVFAFPSRKATELHPAQVRVPLIQMMRELDTPTLLEQLQLKKKDSACQLDLFCTDPGKAIERLGAACEARLIRINIDPAAAERLESQPRTTLAFFVENVTPEEVADILQELSYAEKDRMDSEFSALVVNAGPVMPEDVARVLGGPARDFAPPSQRPLETGTAGEIAHSLPGQVRAGDASKVPHRLAVVVPYETKRAKRCSQVQALVDGYRESRPGTMPLLVVLRVTP